MNIDNFINMQFILKLKKKEQFILIKYKDIDFDRFYFEKKYNPRNSILNLIKIFNISIVLFQVLLVMHDTKFDFCFGVCVCVQLK